MSRKLVDPWLVFDERGRSASSYEQQERRIARLEAENEKLRRLLRGRLMHEGTQTATEPVPTQH